MYSLIPEGILSRSDLSFQVRTYFGWLCERSNREGQSWWGLAKTAAVFHVTPRTISRWRSELIAAGVIESFTMGPRQVLTVLNYPTASKSPAAPPELFHIPPVTYSPPSPIAGRAQGVSAVLEQPRPTADPDPGSSLSEPSGHAMSRGVDTGCLPNQVSENQDRIVETETITYLRSSLREDDQQVVAETIDRIIRIAGTVGLRSFGGRILELRKADNHDRILAASALEDDAIRFAFEYAESLRGTDLYPITTPYLLDQLLLRGSLYKHDDQAEVATNVSADRAGVATNVSADRAGVATNVSADRAEVVETELHRKIRSMVPQTTYHRWFSECRIEVVNDGKSWLAVSNDDVGMFQHYFGGLLDLVIGIGQWKVTDYAEHGAARARGTHEQDPESVRDHLLSGLDDADPVHRRHRLDGDGEERRRRDAARHDRL